MFTHIPTMATARQHRGIPKTNGPFLHVLSTGTCPPATISAYPSTVMGTTDTNRFENLPWELLEKIFERLPVPDVLRLKQVGVI